MLHLGMVKMQIPNRLGHVRRAIEAALKSARQCMQSGDYVKGETVCKQALNDWRGASGPRSEESNIVTTLGKCYEAQRKYEQAYELYMEALPHLTGSSYDDVYTSLLYLNERMGTFQSKKDDKTW
jgi:lipopolysaccharide biosynthesis regulator YciM